MYSSFLVINVCNQERLYVHPVYYVVFSSDIVSNLTMAIKAETCS